MIDTMNDNVCFLSSRIDNINDYIHDRIDARLYLFANYTPKPILDANESEALSKAIINIHSLFQDCGKYIFKVTNSVSTPLIRILENEALLSFTDANFIYDFYKGIISFRSLLCHNSCYESYTSRNHQLNAQQTICDILSACSFDSYETIWHYPFSKKEYSALLDYIVTTAIKVFNILEAAILSIETTQKARLVSKWFNSIQLWYANDRNFLFDALNDYYNYRKINDVLYFDRYTWIQQSIKQIDLSSELEKQFASIQEVVLPQTLFWRLITSINLPTM